MRKNQHELVHAKPMQLVEAECCLSIGWQRTVYLCVMLFYANKYLYCTAYKMHVFLQLYFFDCHCFLITPGATWHVVHFHYFLSTWKPLDIINTLHTPKILETITNPVPGSIPHWISYSSRSFIYKSRVFTICGWMWVSRTHHPHDCRHS